jgi:hypothetical protein
MILSRKGTAAVTAMAAAVVGVIVLGGLLVYVFSSTGVSTSTSLPVTSSPTASSPTTVTPTSFVVNDLSLRTPQSQPPCQGFLCQSYAELVGIVLVDANSPLSCIDISLNGTSAGSTCWNVVSPAFTNTQCNGSNNTSCTVIVSQNTNIETNRTFTLSYPIESGNNIPTVVAGKTYLITLFARFQDGSDATASATIVASVSSNFTVSSVSVTVSSTTTTSVSSSKAP